MPIKGLTDPDGLGIALPRLGVVAKGEKDAEGRPRDLDYFKFRVTGASTPDEERAVLDALTEAFGEKPRAIPIWFITDNPFQAWREEWKASGLVHRCDGESVVLAYDQTSGRYVRPAPGEMPCPGGCRPVGRLEFVIPALRRMATWTLVTGSVQDIRHLAAVLETARSILEPVGGITRAAFLLRRVKRTVHYTDEKGQRRSRDMWLISLEIDPSSVARALQMNLSGAALAMLADPDAWGRLGLEWDMVDQAAALPEPDADEVPAAFEVVDALPTQDPAPVRKSGQANGNGKLEAMVGHLERLADLVVAHGDTLGDIAMPDVPDIPTGKAERVKLAKWLAGEIARVESEMWQRIAGRVPDVRPTRPGQDEPDVRLAALAGALSQIGDPF